MEVINIKRYSAISLIIIIVFSSLFFQFALAEPQLIVYEDLDLQGNSREIFMEVWDLTSCPLQIDFTYNGGGLKENQAHAITKFGIQASSVGSGVWLLLDYDGSIDTFAQDPPGSPKWDSDDIFFLQKADGDDQTNYDPSSLPGDSWIFPCYFDRDGVTPFQASNPLYIDGATYNTQGEYHISLIINAVNETHGFAYVTINGQTQGYLTGNNPYPPLEDLPDVEIIVDDPEATFIGNWYPSTLVPGYYGDGYHYHMAGDGADTFTWAFDLPYAGQWEVSAIWSNRSSRATDSPFIIDHAEGLDTVRVNQEIDGGQWNSLGTFTFNQGETTVTLSDDANQAVIADAIKMELKEISWQTTFNAPAGLSFSGDMRNMQVFYQLDSQGAEHSVEFNDISIQGCLTSLRDRKEQTIVVLNQAHSEEKKIDHGIDKMIDKIEKSLDDKLWIDDYYPAVKHGHKVFDNEKKAVKQGLKIIKDKKTTDEVKETVMQVIDELVSVDFRLAESLYEEASQYGGTKKVDHELEKAQKYLQKAYDELESSKCKYDNVIKHLKKSWEHSQKAIKHAKKLDT